MTKENKNKIYVPFLGQILGTLVAQECTELAVDEQDGILYPDKGNWMPPVLEGKIPAMGKHIGGLDGSGWCWDMFESTQGEGTLIHREWGELFKSTTYYKVDMDSVPFPTEEEASVFSPKWS